MPVHAHLPRPRPARRIITRQPALIVPGHVRTHLRLELRRQTERRQDGSAAEARAREAVVGGLCARDAVVGRRGAGGGGGEAGVGEGAAAGEAAEGQRGAVLEADVVGDLRFEGLDVVVGAGGAGGGGGDAVFGGVEAETGGEEGDVGTGDGGAEAFNWGENLFVEVVVNV